MVWGDKASSSSSLVNWGSSCKRKALEDSSGLLCSGGSSSSLVETENDSWPTGPAINASSSLSVSTPSEDVPITSPPLQDNPINEVWQAASEASDVGSRSKAHVQHQESIPLNLSSTSSASHPSHSSPHTIPGSNSFNDSLELRLTAGVTASNSGAPQNQSLPLHVPGFSGNMHPFPWNGAANLRGATASTSYNSEQRAVWEALNLRILPRDSMEHPMHVPASSGHDPTSWHTSSSNVNDSGAVLPSSLIGSSSSVQSLPNPSWIVNHEIRLQNLQRLEFSPWSLFQPGVHNGRSTSSPSGHPASTQDNSNQQPYARPASLREDAN